MPAAADNVSVPLFLNRGREKRREALGAAGPLLKTNEPALRFHPGGMTWHPVWSDLEPGARRTGRG